MNQVIYLTRKHRSNTMFICQISIKKNHNTMVINHPLRPNAITAVRSFGKQKAPTIERKDIFALWVAMRLIVEKSCLQKNSLHGEVALVIQKRIGDGRKKILNVWPSLNPVGTLGKKAQMAATHLKNGLNYRKHINSVVLFAGSVKNLLETILFHYQKVGLILSQIFNRYAEIVIAKNGNIVLNYFNIYENPELLNKKLLNKST